MRAKQRHQLITTLMHMHMAQRLQQVGSAMAAEHLNKAWQLVSDVLGGEYQETAEQIRASVSARVDKVIAEAQP